MEKQLPQDVKAAGFSISKDYPYPTKSKVRFGKFGDVCMDDMTVKRAKKLVEKGFVHLIDNNAKKAPQKAVAAVAKTPEVKAETKGK